MQSLVGLARTFDNVPRLRDCLCAPEASERLLIRLGSRRSDVIVFAIDRQRSYDASVLIEAREALTRGIPVFVLLYPSAVSAPQNDLWTILDGHCVVLDALDDDVDCAQRIIDALEDHLFGLAPPSTEPNTISRLGEWINVDLAELNIPDYRTYRRLAEEAGGESDHSRFLLERANASESLMDGEVEKSVHTLRRIVADFQPDWSTRYFLGRLLTARSRSGDEVAEAAIQLDKAFLAVGHQMDESEDQQILLSQASCLLALVKLKRRHAETSAAQSDLDELSALPIASNTSTMSLLDAEQIRLHGRRGADGLADVRAGLLDLVWRSPETVVSLVNSLDLAAVRAQICEPIITALDADVQRAARAVVRPAPLDRSSSVRAAVDAARGFAQVSAAELRVRFELLEGLVDQSSDPPRWLVDRYSEEVSRNRSTVDMLERARREEVEAARPSAQAYEISMDIFEPAESARTTPEPAAPAGMVTELSAAAAERTAVRESLTTAWQAKRTADAALANLKYKYVARPERPTPVRLLVGVVAGLGAVASLAAAAAGHPGFLVGVLIGIGIFALCCGPWIAAKRRFAQHQRRVREAQEAVNRAMAEGSPLAIIVRALDALPDIDRKLAQARAALTTSTEVLKSAEMARDEAAAVVRPNGIAAFDFASALAERVRAFNRAFSVHPHLWWPDVVDQRPARSGDLVLIDESSGSEGGLLSGWPGDRLVRVSIDDDEILAVSDVWNAFPDDSQRAMVLERALLSFLAPTGP